MLHGAIRTRLLGLSDDVLALLATYDFGGGDTWSICTDGLQDDQTYPAIDIQQTGGADGSTRGSTAGEVEFTVTVYGEHTYRHTEVLDTIAAAVWKRLNGWKPTGVSGWRCAAGAAEPPIPANDPDGFPGRSITWTCRVRSEEAVVVPETYVRIFGSTDDPTTSDDSKLGYRRGDKWVNTSTNAVWDCISAAAGAAAWRRRTRNHSAASAPGTSNDETQGYGAGDVWIDTTGPTAYVCLSAADGAASWQQVGAGGSTLATRQMATTFPNMSDGSFLDPLPLDDSILHDADIGAWSNGKLTLSEAGKYRLEAVVSVGAFSAAQGGAVVQLRHYDDSADETTVVGRAIQFWPTFDFDVALNAAALIEAEAGDQVYVRAKLSGCNGQLFGGGPGYTALSVVKL